MHRAVLELAVLGAICGPLVLAPSANADPLPDGFVALADLAPTIREDIRYHGALNFTGAPLPGYAAPRCILRRKVAEALARVEAGLAARGLGLVVFDCYRPKRAVAAMLAWTQAAAGPRRAFHHPNVDRGDLVRLGYVAARSLHATGYAVDLAIAPLGISVTASTPQGGDCTDGPEARGEAGLLDFGTAYDCFDPLSSTDATSVGAAARRNRVLLASVMAEAGFAGYAREWWHFSFSQRKSARVQDFVIAPAD